MSPAFLSNRQTLEVSSEAPPPRSTSLVGWDGWNDQAASVSVLTSLIPQPYGPQSIDNQEQYRHFMYSKTGMSQVNKYLWAQQPKSYRLFNRVNLFFLATLFLPSVISASPNNHSTQ